MMYTEIRTERDAYINIIDYISNQLGREYVGRGEVVACEDFGIPQKRRRLVTIFTRDDNGKAFRPCGMQLHTSRR
jgi:DNA (cytosine-5)-methyltransferase 1